MAKPPALLHQTECIILSGGSDTSQGKMPGFAGLP